MVTIDWTNDLLVSYWGYISFFTIGSTHDDYNGSAEVINIKGKWAQSICV